MKKKIIGYQSHMFFPFHNDVEFKEALEEFLSKYAYDEDNQTFEDGFQLNCIFYLNGVMERNEFKNEYDAFVKEWDGDVQGSDDFWAYDESVLEESSKTYEVILTENEYRKVCSVLNEQSAKESMEANPTEEDVEMYGELLDVKIQKDRPRMRGI